MQCLPPTTHRAFQNVNTLLHPEFDEMERSGIRDDKAATLVALTMETTPSPIPALLRWLWSRESVRQMRFYQVTATSSSEQVDLQDNFRSINIVDSHDVISLSFSSLNTQNEDDYRAINTFIIFLFGNIL